MRLSPPQVAALAKLLTIVLVWAILEFEAWDARRIAKRKGRP